MNEISSQIEPYAAAVRKLLKGVIYHDDPVWSQVRNYEYPIREYLKKIGLDMHLDEIGNFAFLYDLSRDDEDKNPLPSLTSRRNLSFLDTLLLVLLRDRLDEYEMRKLENNSSLVLGLDEIKEMVLIFLSDFPNAKKAEEYIEASIKRISQSGFITKRGVDQFDVRPLLRAKISADDLQDIKSKLTEYLQRNKA